MEKVETDLLDDLDLPPEENRQSLFSWLPTILLWVGIVWLWLVGAMFHPKVFSATILLLGLTFVKYFRPAIGNKLLAALMFIGVTIQVYFFPFNYVFKFEIGSFGFGFDLVMLIILVFHIVANKTTFIPFFKRVRGSDRTEEEELSLHQSRVKRFKERFSDKTLPELTAMVDNDKLIPEAIEAAKALLQEKTLDSSAPEPE